MILEVKHLHTLLTIKRTGSIIEASKVLNLTLSAVSHQVRQLETYYECTLFTRKSNPLKFTQHGLILLDLADSVLPLFKKAADNLEQSKTNTQTIFNIALECHSCYQWLIPTLNEFRQYQPNLDIDLSAEFNFKPLPKLKNKTLDLVITSDPVNDENIHYTPLFDFEVMLGVSLTHHLAHKDYLLPQDLANETLIIYPVDYARLSVFTQFLNPAYISPKVIRTSELTLMIVALTSSGRGISCLPSWAFAEFCKHSPVKMLHMGVDGTIHTLFVACRKQDQDNYVVKDFIRCAKLHCLNILRDIKLH